MQLTLRTLTAFVALMLTGSVAAQSKDACGLLKIADLQPVAGATHIKDGVTEKPDPIGTVTCHYEWGTGNNAVTGKYSLDVAIGNQAKMWPGLTIPVIKRGLLNMANATEIPGVGDGSILQSNRAIEVTTMTLIKGQLLTVTLEGPDAQKKKDAMIALTKLAVSRM
jgi:hypothetical protein